MLSGLSVRGEDGGQPGRPREGGQLQCPHQQADQRGHQAREEETSEQNEDAVTRLR